VIESDPPANLDAWGVDQGLARDNCTRYSLATQPAQVYCIRTALFFKAENEKFFRYAVGSGGPGLS
jgi:hypothetical protein